MFFRPIFLIWWVFSMIFPCFFQVFSMGFSTPWPDHHAQGILVAAWPTREALQVSRRSKGSHGNHDPLVVRVGEGPKFWDKLRYTSGLVVWKLEPQVVPKSRTPKSKTWVLVWKLRGNTSGLWSFSKISHNTTCGFYRVSSHISCWFAVGGISRLLIFLTTWRASGGRIWWADVPWSSTCRGCTGDGKHQVQRIPGIRDPQVVRGHTSSQMALVSEKSRVCQNKRGGWLWRWRLPNRDVDSLKEHN